MNYKLDLAYKNEVSMWGSVKKTTVILEEVLNKETKLKENKEVKKEYTIGLGFKLGKHFNFREGNKVLEVEILHKPMLQIKEVADVIRKGELVLARRNKAIADSKAIAEKQAKQKNWENLKAMKEEGKKQEALRVQDNPTPQE